MVAPACHDRPMADPGTLLAGLDDEQRAAAEAVEGPVMILAGAGTGKTRAITHRIAYAVASGAHDASATLAVTFTTKAAGEMRTRLRELGIDGVQARTFHSAALRQLRYFWPRLSDRSFPTIVSSKLALVAEALGMQGLATDPALLRDVAADIEWAKVNFVQPSRITTGAIERAWSLEGQQMASALRDYESVKGDRGILDFEDILLVLLGALRENHGMAREVRGQYRWFTVDEFQDVNAVQRALLQEWLGERDSLCVVGDPSQTIYTFTGASSKYLEDFPVTFPHATVVRLVRCYRCTPEIVGVANSVIQAGTGQPIMLTSQTSAGPQPSLRAFSDDVAEAAAVGDAISAALDTGTPASEIAVLYRINAQSVEVATALAERGIPFRTRGSERFFELPEIREALTRIRGAARAGDEGLDSVAALLGAMGWSPETPTSTGAVRDKWENLSALAALAREQPEGTTLSEFVTELDRRAEHQHSPDAVGVTLASIHAAKGLEWSMVFVVGCSDGLLPLLHAESPEQIEEERRLLYVAVTRAKHDLLLSWAHAREPGGRAVRSVSRFLEGLDAVPHEASRAQVTRGTRSPQRRRRGPATCRTCGRALVTATERTVGRCRVCPATYRDEDFEQLRAWRLDQATQEGVPAYVVFTDATLIAICETQPGSKEELAGIPGIGPAKLERFGDEVLAIVSTW